MNLPLIFTSPLPKGEVVPTLRIKLKAEKVILCEVITLLNQAEDYRLHFEHGYGSMHAFCRKELGMSEGETNYRLNAARFVRKYPHILGAIRSGQLTITNLSLMKHIITDENVDEVLTWADGRAKREVLWMMAARMPKSAMPTIVRKLSTATKRAKSSRVAEGATTSSGGLAGEAPSQHGDPSQLGIPGTSAPASEPTAPGASDASSASNDARPAVSPSQPIPLSELPPPPRDLPNPHEMAPLSADLFRFHQTVDQEFVGLAKRARGLWRDIHRKDDFLACSKEALRDLIAKLEKVRFAKTDRPRAAKPSRDPGYVSRAVRREVFERDGERCTEVNERGERCEETTGLELDHIEARANGGRGDAANLRVVCRGHNKHAAEKTFGIAAVAQRIAESRARRAEKRAAKDAASPPTELATKPATAAPATPKPAPVPHDDEPPPLAASGGPVTDAAPAPDMLPPVAASTKAGPAARSPSWLGRLKVLRKLGRLR